MGLIGGGMLALALVAAVAAPFISPYDPYAPARVTVFDIFQPPSGAHLLGTDDSGKDILSSLFYGARISLLVGFSAAAITTVIGGLVGIVAGYRGGRIGISLMSITDFFLVIPEIALQIVIVAIAGQSLLNIILVIGLLGWASTARLVRSQTLSVRERKFVLRARAIGAGDGHILRRHVVPAVLPLMIANTVLIVSLAILSESTLAFIGLGDPTVISWGGMLNHAFNRSAITAGAWWALFPPGLAIVWVVLGTTLLGTALEDALNPRLKRHYLERERSVPRRGTELFVRRGSVAPGPAAPVLEVRNLTVEFDSPSGPLRAVDDVSFDLYRGETLGLVGESGCGKTTTILGLLRLLPPGGQVVGGTARYGDDDVLAIEPAEMRRIRWSRLSLVFQGAMNALNPVRPVGDQVAEAIRIHEPRAGRREATRRAEQLLERVGIGRARYRDYAHQYSGGMRQRAMIALALACRPDVIMADEPTTALDVMIQAQILELLSELSREMGMSVVLVTHDLGVVAQTCDRLVVMYGGRVAEQGTTAQVFASPKHPYTQGLLGSFPDLGHPERRLESIAGTPPRLDAMPPGCPFEPRCAFAFDRCRQEVPPLYPTGDGQVASCFLLDPSTPRAAEARHA
jgi:oligopeptide/dipeptide ABC transporter ATP-binding protein